MSKAHSIIKLLTFGALAAAAYLQAGSDPESANRLTIMLTSLLGTLSGEVGGDILDRALFDGELSSNLGTAKFIGLLRKGDWLDSVPASMSSRYHIDFRDDAAIEKAYEELLRDIHEAPAHPKPPLLGNTQQS